jgi:YebC/PmpR family DNA-binding regulatory protein
LFVVRCSFLVVYRVVVVKLFCLYSLLIIHWHYDFSRLWLVNGYKNIAASVGGLVRHTLNGNLQLQCVLIISGLEIEENKNMAGHSHWKSIKHKKAVVDARRGKVWSKLARLIIIAAKRGANPDDNLALRYAIDKARAANMPNDTIEKAVKRGAGELGANNYESVLYEGYAPGGVAILVDALTDNRNRTAGEIRVIFDRNGGTVGAANSVGWMFASQGIIAVERQAIAEDRLIELALEAGAQDVQTAEEGYTVLTAVADFEKVRKHLASAQTPIVSAEIIMIPSQSISISGEQARKVQAFIDALEEQDDVQNVYSNAQFED